MTLQYLQVTPWTLALLHNDGSETFLVLFLQKDKGSGAVAKAIFGQLSPKLLASINFMYVYACTGQGKGSHEGACHCSDMHQACSQGQGLLVHSR